MKIVHIDFDELISLENLYTSWKLFKSGKSRKKEVIEFEHNFENNLFSLYEDLLNCNYKHGFYDRFVITDPKVRIIHKSCVRDRVAHTLVANQLERVYLSVFIDQSYACIKGRGIHKAFYDLVKYSRKTSQNYTCTFWYLKLDIRKFFDNIDQAILFEILKKKIKDEQFLWLINEIISSYNSGIPEKGLPLGNFTSQWFANIYLNELDYFIKHDLKIQYYLRYADDFICLGQDKELLKYYLNEIIKFLNDKLKLQIHGNKIIIKKFSSGIDFVGYKVLPHYVLLRKRIKKMMIMNVRKKQLLYDLGQISSWQYNQIVNSYLGWLKYCNGYKLSNQIVYNLNYNLK